MSLSNKELLDKCKDAIAYKEGYDNWTECQFKENTTSIFLLYDQVAELYATEKAKEVINFPENKNEQINYFLVNILRYLDADQALTLAKNLIGRIPQNDYFTRSEVESCIKDSLEAAAENAKTKFISGTRKTDNSRIEEIIDKSSITDTKNIKIK